MINTGVLFGLMAAAFWGAADFAGGLASRRANVYRVVLVSEWSGLLILLPLPLIFHEPLPALGDLLLAGAASASGVVGIIILYRSMAVGQMSIAAPVSALLAAIIPVLVSLATQEPPEPRQALGFVIALAAIWLISSDAGILQAVRVRWAALGLPFLSGVAFGVYFVLLNAASQQATFWPLISARLVGSLMLLGYVAARPLKNTGIKRVWLLAVLCGSLDVSANVGYVLAGQAGRLDVAAVLGALYPGTTVLLAWLVLKERLNLPQAIGILAALAAIVLIAA